MAFHGPGNVPLKSASAPATDPSTATLIAEIDSTAIASMVPTGRRGIPFRVNWRVGASTSAIFVLEQCLSTGFGSTAIRDSCQVFTGSNLTSQFLDHYMVEPGDRFRVRVASSFSGTASAQISAEPLV